MPMPPSCQEVRIRGVEGDGRRPAVRGALGVGKHPARLQVTQPDQVVLAGQGRSLAVRGNGHVHHRPLAIPALPHVPRRPLSGQVVQPHCRSLVGRDQQRASPASGSGVNQRRADRCGRPRTVSRPATRCARLRCQAPRCGHAFARPADQDAATVGGERHSEKRLPAPGCRRLGGAAASRTGWPVRGGTDAKGCTTPGRGHRPVRPPVAVVGAVPRPDPRRRCGGRRRAADAGPAACRPRTGSGGSAGPPCSSASPARWSLASPRSRGLQLVVESPQFRVDLAHDEQADGGDHGQHTDGDLHAAVIGRRRTHLTARSTAPTGRARDCLMLASQRRRSSARGCRGCRSRCSGSFRKHFKQIVFQVVRQAPAAGDGAATGRARPHLLQRLLGRRAAEGRARPVRHSW